MLKKLLIITLIIFLVFLFFSFLIVGFLEIKSPPKKLKAKNPVLFLSSPVQVYKPGESIPVKVSINTFNFKTDGVDVVLNYHPQYLKFKEIDTTNSVFKVFPPYLVDQIKGKIKFSLLTAPQKSFQGQGEVATILFQAVQKGEVRISFDFVPNSNSDSNVALAGQGKDVLKRVNSLFIQIK